MYLQQNLFPDLNWILECNIELKKRLIWKIQQWNAKPLANHDVPCSFVYEHFQYLSGHNIQFLKLFPFFFLKFFSFSSLCVFFCVFLSLYSVYLLSLKHIFIPLLLWWWIPWRALWWGWPFHIKWVKKKNRVTICWGYQLLSQSCLLYFFSPPKRGKETLRIDWELWYMRFYLKFCCWAWEKA